MPVVTVAEQVWASCEHVYAILSDMTQFPRFMHSIESVVIRQSGPGYTVSEWTARRQGARFRWVERDQFFPEDLRIAYSQVEGDLALFQGHWQLTPIASGCSIELVTEFEFGMPMLQAILNPVATVAIRQNARAMVRAISGQVADPPDRV